MFPNRAAEMEIDLKDVPFWDDLFSVTTRVPPWGLFTVLAEHPDIMVKLQVPALPWGKTGRDWRRARLSSDCQY